MKKAILIGDHGWDYEAISFEDSGMSIEEVYEELIENNGDYEFDNHEFGAKIISFDAELTQKDVDYINNNFLDTHQKELFLVDVK